MSDQGFKHITVTTPDEDDFVIQAGIVGKDEPANEEPPIAEAAREPAREPAGKPAEPQEAQSRPTQPEQPADETRRPDAEPARRKTPQKADAYRQTTLEDLESGTMPLAQRIVIIAAIVCIIGAVVYYFAFMR